jgi:YesN/AraC family two-component response regulator
MPRILIVDDERAIRSLLAKVFLKAGYEVHTAACGDHAIALCAVFEPVDVLLTDITMPAMNGHDLVRSISELHPTIRCVLMTGFDDVDCQDCPIAPKCPILRKPFLPNDAVSLVAQVLGASASPA